MSIEIITNLILALSFGIAIALFITPIFVYLKKIMYHKTQNKKWLDKAIKDGHIVTAKKIKEHDLYRNTNNGLRVTDNSTMATYQYTYNGKTYKKKFVSYNNQSDEINLYFINNPRKAECGTNLWVSAKNHWIRSYLLMVLAVAIISLFILMFK